MKKIITTVGISIFTNAVKREKEKKIDTLDRRLSTYLKDDPIFEKWSSFEEDIEENGLRDLVYQAALKDGCNASAEIKSLIKIAEEEEGDLVVVLLATDTVLSVLACELICKWINERYPSVKVKENEQTQKYYTVIKDLQVNDVGKFQTTGFQSLLKILKQWSNKDKDVIFNISGGYKAIIPFMTLYAQLEEIPLKYIYEESHKVLTVGNLPISFDWAKAERYYLLLQDGKDYINNNNQKDNEDAKVIIEECRQLGLIFKNQITELGTLFRDYVKLRLDIGKNSLGFLIEYKLFEYFQFYDTTTKKGKVSRSVQIEHFPSDANNLPKGNEIDLFIELSEAVVYNGIINSGNSGIYKPMSNEYITIEVKPLVETKPEQFKAFLERVKLYWESNLPKEVRLIVYSFLPIDYAKRKFDSDVQIQKQANLVKDILGVCPFRVQHINIDIAFNKLELSNTLMKEAFKQEYFIGEKIFINGIQKI